MKRQLARRKRLQRGGTVPPGFRELLERKRLSLLTLFRALDRLGLVQELPSELRMLFELDADIAEALCVLDKPGRFDLSAMTHDTMASLQAIPNALQALFALLSESEQEELSICADVVRVSLHPLDAYQDVPGRDPSPPCPR